MKRRVTHFLKATAIVIVILILGFFILVLPRVSTGLSRVISVPSYLRYTSLVALHAAIIPFIFALYQATRLLINTHKNKAFTGLSIKASKNIKYSAVTISALYVIAMPFLYILGDKDDAPGIILFSLIVILAGIICAGIITAAEKRHQPDRIH